MPEAGIRFLMIGGHAVNPYGYTRATMDVDFMIAAEDAPVVLEVMVMKLFALKNGSLRRKARDSADIVQLVIENKLDV